MSDEQYLIPTPRAPEPTDHRPHGIAVRLSIAAILVAGIAAVFTGWQAYEAHAARVDAAKTSKDQSADVSRARAAAEDSAKAVSTLAAIAHDSVKAAQDSAAATKVLADEEQMSLTLASRGAKASERSAAAAERSLERVSVLHKIDQEPSMSLSGYLAQRSSDQKHIHFDVPVINDGKTPATHLKRQIGVFLGDRMLTSGVDDPPAMLTLSVHPGLAINHTIDVDLTEEQATEVVSGAVPLHVVLFVQYNNEVGDLPRSGGWCLQYRPQDPLHYDLCAIQDYVPKPQAAR